jgi:hypothetical protein
METSVPAKLLTNETNKLFPKFVRMSLSNRTLWKFFSVGVAKNKDSLKVSVEGFKAVLNIQRSGKITNIPIVMLENAMTNL